MRNGLQWTLVVTLVLSAWALWAPQQEAGEAVGEPGRPAVVAVREPGVPPSVLPSAQPASHPPVWPDHLQALQWGPAKLDPFVPMQLPPPPAPKVVVQPVQPLVAPMQPPLMDYRYLGRMQGPDGQTHVYLVKADRPVPISVGAQLPDGFVVQAITAEAVQLYYPPLQAKVAVFIPAAQDAQDNP